MDQNDRHAIEGLFGKLGQAAQAQPHRDPQAEATILKLRQAIADGKQFEDPDKIATLFRDIYSATTR